MEGPVPVGRAAEPPRDGHLLLGHGQQGPWQPRSPSRAPWGRPRRGWRGRERVGGGQRASLLGLSPRARRVWQLLWLLARSSGRCRTWTRRPRRATARARPPTSSWPWVSRAWRQTDPTAGAQGGLWAPPRRDWWLGSGDHAAPPTALHVRGPVAGTGDTQGARGSHSPDRRRKGLARRVGSHVPQAGAGAGWGGWRGRRASGRPPGQASSPSATATARAAPSPCWSAAAAAGAGPPACTWPPRLTPRLSSPTTGYR